MKFDFISDNIVDKSDESRFVDLNKTGSHSLYIYLWTIYTI